MPVPSTYTNTYNLTVGEYLDIEPLIHLLDPHDVPLTGGTGADGRSVLTSGPCFEKVVSWLDEELLVPRTTAAAAATSAATSITVAATDGVKFGIGDVISLDGGDQARITAIAGDVLTVTRGYGGTTAAAVTSGKVIVGVGTALVEGSNPQAAKFQDRTKRDNYTQIFGPYGVQTSMSENAVRKYGISDAGSTEHSHQVGNRLKEGMVAIEQALLYGVAATDSSNAWRTMGGINHYTTTNVNTSAVAFTEALLLAQLQAAFEAGGNPDRLVVGPAQKRAISTWNLSLASGAVTVNVDRTDAGRGQVVSYYDSDFGRISVVLDRWAKPTDAFGFNRDQAEVLTLRPFQYEQLAKTGDRIEGQIVGEKSLRWRRERHGFKFTALT